MTVTETRLPGVFIIEPRLFKDERGFFLETYRESLFHELGINKRFVQDNHSHSRYGVLRGLHYQLIQPQGKLVRVVRGAVFDVAVDIRRNSPTFGQWAGCILDDDKHLELYIPPGFAHGFCVLSDSVDFVYKCTDYYHAESEHGIAWNDPDIAIDWPLSDVIVSAKDKLNPNLCDQEHLPAYLT